AICSGAAARAASRTRSTAQLRLAAVGRAPRSCAHPRSSASEVGSRATSIARPYAPATPISGAPRTLRRRIAAATSSALVSVRTRSSAGSRVWSMIARRPPSQLSGGAPAVALARLVALDPLTARDATGRCLEYPGHRVPLPPMRARIAAAALVALLGGAAPAQAGDPIMPLSQVRSGMHCTGLSVIRGTDIASFTAALPAGTG